jgi:hypothetical protein
MAIWKLKFDYGKADAYDKTAELTTSNVDFAYGGSPTYGPLTHKPLFVYDQYGHIAKHVMSYAQYWMWLADATMQANNLRWSAHNPLNPTVPILEGTVNITEPIVGLQTPRDVFGSLKGNFLQIQWQYAWNLPIEDENWQPNSKIVQGRDTLFGVNNIGDNLGIRAGASEVLAASSSAWPDYSDDDTTNYNLNDFLGFVQSLHPISYTRKFTPPQWAIAGNAAVKGTLYHGRSKLHQKRKGY